MLGVEGGGVAEKRTLAGEAGTSRSLGFAAVTAIRPRNDLVSEVVGAGQVGVRGVDDRLDVRDGDCVLFQYGFSGQRVDDLSSRGADLLNPGLELELKRQVQPLLVAVRGEERGGE